ncbi:ELWxxDGT repeat protein, partial [Sulfitobacter donghicola]
IVIFKDKGYFVAFDGSNGIELWQTDGTTGGTVLFKDLNPGGGSSTPSDLIVADGLMYFGADDGTSGAELWVTDGTSAGTTLVKDVRVGANGSFAQPVGVIDINVAPEQATLSNNTTAENVASGTTIGTLAAVDVDGDALTYTLTNDAGG